MLQAPGGGGEAILDGRQPDGVTLPGLLEGVPVVWSIQSVKLNQIA